MQFYKTSSKYQGPITSPRSIASEYLSSIKTQTSNHKIQNNSNRGIAFRSPQQITKPLFQDQERFKTQTVHFTSKAHITNHVKSLSSDIQATPFVRKKIREEKMIFQPDNSSTPFLIIQNKAREFKRSDLLLKKGTLPSIKTESSQSLHVSIHKLTEPLYNIPIKQIQIQKNNQFIIEPIPSENEILIQETEILNNLNEEKNNTNNTYLSPENEKSRHLFDLLENRSKSNFQENKNINSIIQFKNEIKNEQDDNSQSPPPSPSMKKLSVKMKFKNAVNQQVQTMFQQNKLKSLFSLIISSEFNQKHEQERQKISDKLEAGNHVLGKDIELLIKQIPKKKCISNYKLQNQHKIKNIIYNQQAKLNITNKAFQRKILMIKNTQIKSKDSEITKPERISIFAKHNKKQSAQAIQHNIDTILEHIDYMEQEKYKITIINDQLQEVIQTFNKPKFFCQENENIQQQQQQQQQQPLSPLTPQTPLSPKTPTQKNIIQKTASFKLNRTISQSVFINSKDSQDISVNKMHAQENVDEINNLSINLEYQKSNLYVRLYYQKRLHNLPQKTTYTSLNFIEIANEFQGYYTWAYSSQFLFTQNKSNVSKYEKQDEINMLGLIQQIELEKYEVLHLKDQFSINIESNISSSSISNKSGSFDEILEAPQEKQQKKIQSMIDSMKNLSDAESSKGYIEDVIRCSSKQLLSGQQLGLIKKARNNFHIMINLTLIISILDQKTKNELLTFNIKELTNQELIQQINHEQILTLDEFYTNKNVRNMISQQMEYRYHDILIGTYQNNSIIIDFEHQEQEQQKDNEKQYILNIDSQQQTRSTTTTFIRMSKQYKSRKNIHQQNESSLTLIIQPRLHKKQTNNSPELQILNKKPTATTQYTKQFTNVLTQASTQQYLTKPTNQSQQTSHNVSHSELSRESSLQSQKSGIETQKNITQNLQFINNQINSEINHNMKKSIRKHSFISQNQQTNQQIDIQEQKSILINQKPIKVESFRNLNMFPSSLKMRTEVKEQTRRQKLNQLDLLEQYIYDKNYLEFSEQLNDIPQMHIDKRLFQNNTYLMIAVQNGCKDMVEDLLRRNADINVQNTDGNTATHLAVAYGHFEIADLLIQSGANTHILNKYGQNAWSMY